MDADGYIRIKGRAKDLVIRGGENIPVVEFENLLLEQPAKNAGAIVAMPDPRLVVPHKRHYVKGFGILNKSLRGAESRNTGGHGRSCLCGPPRQAMNTCRPPRLLGPAGHKM